MAGEPNRIGSDRADRPNNCPSSCETYRWYRRRSGTASGDPGERAISLAQRVNVAGCPTVKQPNRPTGSGNRAYRLTFRERSSGARENIISLFHDCAPAFQRRAISLAHSNLDHWIVLKCTHWGHILVYVVYYIYWHNQHPVRFDLRDTGMQMIRPRLGAVLGSLPLLLVFHTCNTLNKIRLIDGFMATHILERWLLPGPFKWVMGPIKGCCNYVLTSANSFATPAGRMGNHGCGWLWVVYRVHTLAPRQPLVLLRDRMTCTTRMRECSPAFGAVVVSATHWDIQIFRWIRKNKSLKYN